MKLNRKSSQATVSTVRCDPQDSRAEKDLEVTNFEQTPYSQRYGNTKRAETLQIRSCIEDALEDEDNDTQPGFDFDVPEHLPNSPLCPLNAKHTICPLHGRRKKAVSPNERKVKPVVKRGPTIVFEGGVGAARPGEEREDAKRAKLEQDD